MSVTVEKLLRIQFQELSGRRADGRWSVDKLKESVQQLILENEKREAEVADREAKKAQIKAEQEARIAERGTLEEFLSKRRSDMLSESDEKFAFLLRRAVSVIEQEKVAVTNFAKEVQENPIYALSWSKGLFEVTAKAKVAREMIFWFEAGRTYEGWIVNAQEEALRMARSPAMSTSPTSNLMETYIAAAWADAASGWW
jgi:hypothetical protein